MAEEEKEVKPFKRAVKDVFTPEKREEMIGAVGGFIEGMNKIREGDSVGGAGSIITSLAVPALLIPPPAGTIAASSLGLLGGILSCLGGGESDEEKIFKKLDKLLDNQEEIIAKLEKI